MDNNNLVRKLIQGGAVGIAIATLALSGFIANRAFNLMENHLQENIKIQQELKASVDTLDEAINRLISALNKTRSF